MGETVTNKEVYENMVEPVLTAFLEGINGTIMVYGPTGAGKTYTMLGSEERREKFRATGTAESALSFLQEDEGEGKDGFHNNGVLLYAMETIFKNITTGTDSTNCTNILKCSYIEIYNDSIYDLLQEKNRIQCPLLINEIDTKEFVVKDVIEHTVSNTEEFFQIIKKGESMIIILWIIIRILRYQ